MGWIVVLIILMVLACFPIGVCAKYNAEGPMVALILGPVRFTVFPRSKEKKKKTVKSSKQSEPSGPKEEPLPQPPKPPEKTSSGADTKQKGGSLLDFLPLVRVALDFLGDFRRKLRVDDLEMKLILAGGDPCDLAVNYGRCWAAVGGLIPQLERLFVIRNRNIEIECDFCAEETKIIARLDLTITLGRVLCLVLWYGARAFKEFLTIQKKRKGGAVT